MRVHYEISNLKYNIDTLHTFLQLDAFWRLPIIQFYPELENLASSEDLLNHVALSEMVKRRFLDVEQGLKEKKITYQKVWDIHEKQINETFTSIFGMDVFRIFNDLRCRITLNPISPRFLEEHTFDVFYLNSDYGALGSTLHELVHFLWFYKWKTMFPSYIGKETEFPHLVWLLSEAVVEPILNNAFFNSINPYCEKENAYPYFYKMKIEGEFLFEKLNLLYESYSMEIFMKKSYALFLKYEEQIRNQINS